MNITLLHPNIPQNTGNIARLCVGLGWRLHLIRPLGFSMRESRLQRAGLDYLAFADITIHGDWDAYLAATGPAELFFASTRGTRSYLDYRFTPDTHLVFGNEHEGLPPAFYTAYQDRLYRIPMPGPHARSINLSNAVAIVAYEAYRQLR